jgi:putative NADH-flavin reductase
MKQKLRVAILGGGGRTGQFVVAELVQQQNPMKLLLRTPNNFGIQHNLFEIIKGDACDPDAIDVLMQNCQAVISTIGQRKDEPLVAERATKNVITAMEKYKLQRYILLAGLNIDMAGDHKSARTIAATEWMRNNFPHIQQDRQNALSRLAQSDLDWTMVRVPFIHFVPGCRRTKINLTDCLGDSIMAGDIANFLVQQLTNRDFIRQAPFIANVD